LNEHLTGSYKKKLGQILKLVNALPADSEVTYSGLAYMYIPDFLAQYGLDDIQTSLGAMEKINMVTSCEFAIRPFLLLNQEAVMKQMLSWSKHPHQNIRRFASEGCRPRLPWGAAIPSFKKDPAPILPVLENLKADSAVYVQKSVANNLNDISKDHPGLVLKIVKRWQGNSPATDRIIKHACRGLLKNGHKEVLHLFGTGSHIQCQVTKLKLSNATPKIKEEIHFEVDLELKESQAAKLRLEYIIYYLKANGSLSKKIFKINEAMYQPNKTQQFRKKHSFRDLTTRKHYPGTHFISIVVNGNEMVKQDFKLLL
jgi:3-methyladenine DNA glycosylase AlkC